MKLFRVVSICEGVSWLLLLAAMPFKYVFHLPQGVQVMGRIHGGLFVAFMLTLVLAAVDASWGPRRIGQAMLAAVVPGGVFWLERQLRREQPVTRPAP